MIPGSAPKPKPQQIFTSSFFYKGRYPHYDSPSQRITQQVLMMQSSVNVETLVSQHAFLQLASSKTLYPNSLGDGLTLLLVNTRKCRAVIALQGAQLLEFIPADQADLLWLSPRCVFTPGMALRGGIPICLPWFGVNRQDPGKPKHGFVRTQDWDLTGVQGGHDDTCELHFTLASAPNALFAYAFTAQLQITLGTSAQLALTVTSNDQRPFTCSWALHSYHPVAALKNARVLGLEGRTYLDNLENFSPKQQVNNVTFSGEVDRVFPGIENTLTIAPDPRILIEHGNCPSVVVWNPGPENAAKIADIGAGNEQGYICVERGAVLDEEWRLEPGESRTGWIRISQG